MIKLDGNIAAFERSLSETAREVFPACIVMALNDTAQDNLDALRKSMEQEFDRPTRWTLNAFMVWRAGRGKWVARVQERPAMGRRHYLRVQASGGVRPNTAIETLMKSHIAVEGDFNIITPAKGAKLDANGNWSPGQRNQVLSALGAQRDRAANATARSKARSKGKRLDYFVPKPGSGLKPGVYARGSDGQMTKVLNFSPNGANYESRFPFEEKNIDTARAEFPRHLKHRLSVALHRP